MSTMGLYSVRFSLRKPRPFDSAALDAVDGPVPAEIEMLGLLRGARPDRLRALANGDRRPVTTGYTLRQVLDDLHDRLRRH